MSFTSRLLMAIPGIQHAFLTATEAAAFDKSLLVDIKQVHGTDILTFAGTPLGRPHVDGIFTHLAGQHIGVVTADCLPLLLASSDGKFISSIHAGWRGAAQGILQRAVEKFVTSGVKPEAIRVAIGPHIRPCCYEVSAAFYSAQRQTPGGQVVGSHLDKLFSRHAINASSRSAAARQNESLWFDLPGFAVLQLRDAGILPEHIDIMADCTYCAANEELGSYRRRTHYPATKTQQLSWIVRV